MESGRRPELLLAALFGVSGVLHFVRPEPFESIVPPALEHTRELVYASGAAELACAAGLVTKRRWAPWASVALLVAIFPANVYMAVDYLGDPARSGLAKAVAIARLPLQGVLIALALKARR